VLVEAMTTHNVLANGSCVRFPRCESERRLTNFRYCGAIAADALQQTPPNLRRATALTRFAVERKALRNCTHSRGCAAVILEVAFSMNGGFSPQAHPSNRATRAHLWMHQPRAKF
jgi:hypothetical protein